MALDFDPHRRSRYSQGAGMQRLLPGAVARPTDLDALRSVLASANAAGLSITPRGAGTAMDGSNIGRGAVVDMSRFDAGRCAVDHEVRTAQVSPSLTLGALATTAKAFGLRFPPDPSSAAWATVGGAVSTNAAGPRSVRYGSVRPWVGAHTLETLEGSLRLVRGAPADREHPVVTRWHRDAEPYLSSHAAEITSRYPAVRKNSAGYALDRWLESGDLIDIVVGSEGTLGVVTDVTLALDTVPAERASLRIALRDRASLPAVLEAVRKFDPSTLEYLDASFLRVTGAFGSGADAAAQRNGLLLVDFEGNDHSDVMERAHAAREASGHADSANVATGDEAIAQLWSVRHGASPALAALTDGRRSLQVIEDGCVPIHQLPAYLDAVEGACARRGVDVVMFGHAGDGHMHVNLLPNLNSPGWLDAVRKIYHEVSAVVRSLGGTVSGEHGSGRLRAPLMRAQYGDTVMECFRLVKHAFDPAGRLNPGVILGADDPFGSIKVGASAPPIDTELATWLDDLERSGQWGTDRW
jgi:FAD/FMN-containing dehydrogenase